MSNYIIYKSEETDEYIVEMFNEGLDELYNVQHSLVQQGFIIIKVDGLFIKCLKKELDTGNGK